MLILASLALFAPLVRSVAVSHHVLHEKRDNDDIGHWQKAHRVDANNVIPVRIGLKQKNLESIYDRLLEVYVQCRSSKQCQGVAIQHNAEVA